MILKLLNWQGIAGIAVSLALTITLVIQKADTRHWKKQSASFEQLYRQDRAAFASTVADYRAAASQAQAADKANAERVAADQSAINRRTADEYEARLAAARSLAQRLRNQAASAAANPDRSGTAPVSGLSASPDGTAQAASQDGLPLADGQIATEQAIQLDELIKWVRQQHAIDPNAISKTP